MHVPPNAEQSAEPQQLGLQRRFGEGTVAQLLFLHSPFETQVVSPLSSPPSIGAVQAHAICVTTGPPSPPGPSIVRRPQTDPDPQSVSRQHVSRQRPLAQTPDLQLLGSVQSAPGEPVPRGGARPADSALTQ
jgi:hypothetical protein